MAHAPKTQSEKATLAARRAWCYLVLVLISFLCLFFFYVLVINSTRTHFEIQKGFSLLPGKSLMTNLKNVLNDANIPVLTGVRNSLIVSACSAALSVYFSALTAYGINPVVQSLIIDGIFAGVGSVLSFLPVIVVLFFFLSILEDTGYMARVRSMRMLRWCSRLSRQRTTVSRQTPSIKS